MSTDTPRAVVADDSNFMRTVIADALESGGVDVVGRARNGREAVDLVVETAPDVVTMDVEMPEMDGIEAVEAIMERYPTPILMLSAHTDENADVTFEALDRGAVDFFRKPGGEVSMEVTRLQDQLVEVVSSVAGADVTGASKTASSSVDDVDEAAGAPGTGVETAASVDEGPATPAIDDLPTTPDDASGPTVVVGSSTGGPKEVERFLAALPLAAGLRVLIVQHMPAGFTGRFARRIDARSDYDVSEASDGDLVGRGDVLVAAGDKHLVVTDDRDGRLAVACTDDPPVNSVRPAVDVTMESAAAVVDGPLVGVVLTGMGVDGAEGIRRIKAAGGRTIAQDEATSAVYGMPRRAVETGCVDDVLPVEDVPAGVIETLTTEVT